MILIKKILENIENYSWNNPIFKSEFSRKLRNNRLYIIQSLYLSLLVFILYIIWMDNVRYNSYTNPAYMGKQIFMTLLFLQFLVVLLLCPSFSCGGISSECEKKTFDILLTSLLISKEIIAGKLNSSFAFILLLIISSIPVSCVVFLFGGISFIELLLSYICIALLAIFISMMGLFISARTKKTNTSIAISYVLTFFIFVCSIGFIDNFMSSGQIKFFSYIDFYLFKLPLWFLLFFEIIFLIIIMFLATSLLIEKFYYIHKDKSVKILFSLFYLINVMLLSFKYCIYIKSSSDLELVSFYYMILFFSIILMPFFIWPGNIFSYIRKDKVAIVPFLTSLALILALLILSFCSSSNLLKILYSSVFIIFFIYSVNTAGRYISTFFESEDTFVILWAIVSWVPLIISWLIRDRSNYGQNEIPEIIKFFDPFMVIKCIWHGGNVYPEYSAIFYIALIIVFKLILYRQFNKSSVYIIL